MNAKNRSIKKRDDIYSVILQALNNIASGKESDLLLFNIWGPHGSGKTYMLDLIKGQVQSLGNVKIFGPIDLSKKDHDLLDKTLNDTKKTSHLTPKIVLLDNLKSVVREGQEDMFIYDVEERLIGPVLSTGDTVIVVTSLHEIKQWRSVEVRARHRTILIPPFAPKKFKETVKSGKLNYITVLKKTLGHPKLLEWLMENPSWDMEKLDGKALEYFLNGLEPVTRRVAQAVSLSFSFNVPAYQTIVKSAKLDGNSSYFSDLKKIKELGSIGLITYESTTGMYHFSDPVLRGVLARSFMREFPNLATEIYNALAELAERESIFVNSLPSHFLNLLYYQAWKAKLHAFPFREWLDQWFHDREDLSWQDVNRQILSNPSSKYILAELKKIADPEIFKTIELKLHSSGEKNEKQ